MPRPHTTMRKIRDVLRLRFGDELSLRQVANSLALPHTTVADYVKRAREAGLDLWPLPEELGGDDALERRLFPSGVAAPRSHPDPDFTLVKKDLAKKGVTLMLLWVEYCEQHQDGYSYSQFCHLYRSWSKKLDVTMRQDHRAGEKLFVDFPGLTIPVYDDHDLGVRFRAELFVAVLGSSSCLYAEALRSQQLIHWIAAHQNCFEFFGGVPEILVPDNLRSAVTKAHRYEPDVNATYQEMAERSLTLAGHSNDVPPELFWIGGRHGHHPSVRTEILTSQMETKASAVPSSHPKVSCNQRSCALDDPLVVDHVQALQQSVVGDKPLELR